MSRIGYIGPIFRTLSFNLRMSNKMQTKSLHYKRYSPFYNFDFHKKYYQTKMIEDENKLNAKKDGFKSRLEMNLHDKDYELSSDPDVFGGQYCLSDELEDKGDLKEEEYIKEFPSGNKELINFSRQIKKHLNKKQIKEALDVLEIEMKKERIHPDKYIFNLLISGCAKVGYARKAFKLFFKMKQSGLTPSESTYTSLFNACANAPSITDGLSKVKRLREIIIENSYQLNQKNYNAMIKAYGRCGDLHSAFSLVDEMIEKGFEIETSTFNFLLQACASDKDFGFRHALLIWHKMKRKNIAPDIYTFNTIIKCVKDCLIGDVDTINNVINSILSDGTTNHNLKEIDIVNDAINETTEEMLLVEQTNKCSNLEIIPAEETTLKLSTKCLEDSAPNLFCSTPHLGNLIEIKEIRTPEERLLLLGGFLGFLEEMKFNKITPSIETFTALLEVVPATLSAEKKLISIIRKLGLRVDIDFFNTLIKKRCMRLDYNGAKDVLNMIKTVKLQPDIYTYGILALTCTTKDDSKELVYNMKQKNMKMNIEILGAMLNQGCRIKDFEYVSEIMKITLDERIRPNEFFLIHLSRFNNNCAKMIDVRHPLTKSSEFQTDYKKFKEKLHTWYKANGISGLELEEQIKIIKENPYKKFRENTKDEVYGNKNKIRKLIKKIKMNDLKDVTKEEDKAENIKL